MPLNAPKNLAFLLPKVFHGSLISIHKDLAFFLNTYMCESWLKKKIQNRGDSRHHQRTSIVIGVLSFPPLSPVVSFTLQLW